MKLQVRAAIADVIKREGVTHAFGHTGGHIRLMWNALNDVGVKTVFNKQEGNAVYMADGFAKLTGEIPVVLGTSGPGVENMIAATSSAFLDSVPMVIIGAMVPTFAVGKNALQDSSGRGRAVEQRLVFKACTKQAMLAPTPAAVPTMIREAFRTALSGRPGPVYVEVPSDFWNIEIEYQPQEPSSYKNLQLPACPDEGVDQIIKAFKKSEQPVVIVGEGAIERTDQNKKRIRSFLKRLGIPFIVSPLAKSLVDERSELWVGSLRNCPAEVVSYEYLREADFVLMLGARFNQWEARWVYDRQNLLGVAKLAQVDPDPEEIGRSFGVDYSVVGSVSSFIEKSKVRGHKNSENLVEFLKKLRKGHPKLDKIHPDNKKEKLINPRNLNTIVEKYATDDAIIVTDTGYAGSMAVNHFRTSAGQDFLMSDRNSPMGYSIPAALGAGLVAAEHDKTTSNPHAKREVICFVGDGGVHMSCNEFGLLMDYPSKVIFIVQDNSGCICITDQDIAEFGKTCVTQFTNPDFIKLAEAYGMKAVTVTNTQEFEAAFLQAQQETVSTLIDCKIDQQIMVWE